MRAPSSWQLVLAACVVLLIVLGIAAVVGEGGDRIDDPRITDVPLPPTAPAGAAYRIPADLLATTGGPYLGLEWVKHAASTVAGRRASVANRELAHVVFTTWDNAQSLRTQGSYSYSRDPSREVYVAALEADIRFTGGLPSNPVTRDFDFMYLIFDATDTVLLTRGLVMTNPLEANRHLMDEGAIWLFERTPS